MTPEPNTPQPNTTLREALHDACPTPPLPESLTARVAALAAASAATRAPRLAHRRRTRLRLLGAGATAALILCFLLIPRPNPVNAYQRMLDSLRDVRSRHTTTWSIRPDGTRTKANETWYQKGNWRIDDPDPKSGSIHISRSGKLWGYEEFNNTVTKDTVGASPDWSDGVIRDGTFNVVSLDTLLRQYKSSGGEPHITVMGPTTEGGKAVHRIMLTSRSLDFKVDPRKPLYRQIIDQDDATGLPVRLEQQTRKPDDTQWVTDSIEEDQYNQPLPASVFAPDFPKSARYINVVAQREYWRNWLNKGVAAQKIALPDSRRRPVNVVIRDFQVNQKGDVFLLFTANTEIGRDIPFGMAELTDEFGTKYVDPSSQNNGVGAQDFVPNCIDPTATGGKKISGFAFGDRQLEGIRWIPLQTQAPWQPRRFRLTLHLADIGTVVFNLPVRKAEADIVPDYMPFTCRPLSAYAPVQTEEELQARAWAFRHDEHDLPQALAAYQKLIALRTQEQKQNGETVTNSDQWLEIYSILTDMGRLDEAKAALLKAKKDNDIWAFDVRTCDKIQAAMKKEGLTP